MDIGRPFDLWPAQSRLVLDLGPARRLDRRPLFCKTHAVFGEKCMIEDQSGLSRQEIEREADVYVNAERVICT
ncbi:hypothetical protein ACC699_40800, partial [Rhizobium ruizarguesonis]